ncbi:class I SAM-dependent methyltransferase [Paraliomyxa miuraensis]|uniref:class I SAM-dependent methyltransferase n=1 Tax=Paraliomyxa miuraensis TaxID=376150 RepID=UPI00225979D8|nr:methyltransferase domain-containing protein [Paraliomyxa miuraensis]MCX4239271.1 methyltransferase domain-containing protein [Paraliomyxa miuraensis]
MASTRVLLSSALLVAVAGLGGYRLGAGQSSAELEARLAELEARVAKADEARGKAQAKAEKAQQDAKVAKAKLDEAKPAAPSYTCNICKETGQFRRFAGRKGVVCPTCKSKERHRLLMHWIANASPLATEELDVLHFSPEDAEKDFLRKFENLHYVTADYLHKEELRLDLTALDLPDASWDVLIVYHILEHIVEDQRAMAEMFRVLRPGGMAILQVPIEVGREEIYEDASIVDPKERRKAFGQKDHVRRYSASGFQVRLEQAGFEVEAVDHIAELGPEEVAKHRMAGAWRTRQDERIWLAKKPEDAPGRKGKVKAKTEAGSAKAP